MSKQEIIEENKLIAEFMELKIFNIQRLIPADGYYDLNDRIYPTNIYINKNSLDYIELIDSISSGLPIEIELYKCYEENSLRYHVSWDWLIPVVEKIENDLKDSFTIDIINKNQCEVIRNGDEFICGYGFETVNHLKIEAVYNSIVKFIKWYKLCQKEK